VKLKTYQAWTMAEALAFVKTDLGADAVILHTRTFERGGFFGIGRKSVVEITAARAKDMPQKEVARRPDPRAAVRAPAQPERNASSERAGEVLRASAAARAYGAQPNGGLGSGAGASPSATPGVAVNKPLDMDSEREKTRRLAQAMAVQLEKQATERATATRNEDVVREVAIRGAQSAAASATSATSAANNGPAQRFVLVPEPSERGGATRLTAAVVRVPEPTPSISPTHSSLELAQSDAGKPAARATTPSDGELDAISAFVGRVLQRGGADAAAGPASNPVSIPVSPPGAIPVREVVEIRAVAAKPARARSLETAYAKLIEQEVAEELATRVLADIGAQFASQIEAGVEPSQDDLRIAIERRLAAVSYTHLTLPTSP
jgi:flagellar biosynthesis GTPase FlhF